MQEMQVSKHRDRDAVLGILVPKMLEIVRAKGLKIEGFGERSVQLTDEVVLSTSSLGAERIMVSVYDGPAKVFSAHVNDSPNDFDPGFFRYRGGRVAVLSWRRGAWEDAVVADPPLHANPECVTCGFRSATRARKSEFFTE
jgi:hypothetical protein